MADEDSRVLRIAARRRALEILRGVLAAELGPETKNDQVAPADQRDREGPKCST